jgi:hypothetical protein
MNNPNLIIEMGKFSCTKCGEGTWMFPKSQEEVDTFQCIDCTVLQAKEKINIEILPEH